MAVGHYPPGPVRSRAVVILSTLVPIQDASFYSGSVTGTPAKRLGIEQSNLFRESTTNHRHENTWIMYGIRTTIITASPFSFRF